MLKSFAIIPVVAVALAQAQAPSLVPTGISDTCNTFLTELNTDSGITACTTALIQATSSFGSAAKNSSNAVTSTLSALCAPSLATTCSNDLFAGKLAAFYSACSNELTANPNAGVVAIYDTIYNIKPFKDAICSLDDSGNYCSTQSKLPANTNAEALQAALSSPSPSNSAALIPNTNTFSTNDISFLFLTTPVASDACTVCTRQIMNAYMTFQATVQYALGIKNSPLLSNQPALYASINSVCGATFLEQTGVVKAAGGLSGGTFSSSGAVPANGVAGGFAAAGMGLLAILAASVL